MGKTTKQVVVLQFEGDAKALTTAINQVDKDLGELVIQTDRAQAALGKNLGKGADAAASGLRKSTHAMNQYTKAQNIAMRGAGQMRANVQNVGFQMQDIAVQLEMGTHWSRVFAQQGTQILGVFGPMATILGAVAAGVIAVANAYGIFNNATKNTTKAAEDLEAKVSAVAASLEFIHDSDLTEKFGDLSEVMRTLATDMKAIEQVQLQRSLESFMESMGKEAGVTFWENVMIGGALVFGTSQGAAALKDSLGFDALGFAMGEDVFNDLLGQLREAANSGDLALVTQLFQQIAEDATDGGTAVNGITDAGIQMLASLEKAAISTATMRQNYIDTEKASVSASKEDLELHKQRVERNIKMRQILADTFAMQKAERDKALKADIERRLLMGEILTDTHAMQEALRDNAVDEWVDSFWEAEEAVSELEKDIGGAGVKALELAGVDIASPIAGAVREAALLAGELGVSLAIAKGIMALGSAGSGMDEWGIPEEESRMMDMQKEIDKALARVPEPKSRGGGASKELEKAAKEAEKLAEALAKAEEEANQFGKTMEDSLAGLATSAIDNFVDALVSGQANFKDFARAILADLAKIMLRAAIVNALMSAFGGKPGQAATGLQRIVQQVAGITQVASAQGNVFQGGNVVPFAKGGVVGGPTVFPMTNGVGLMGEAGPEAVMPLQRNSTGDLGVAGPAITINNYTGEPVSVDRSEEMITIAVGRAVQATESNFVRSMSSGQGAYARAIEGNYSARRKAT